MALSKDVYRFWGTTSYIWSYNPGQQKHFKKLIFYHLECPQEVRKLPLKGDLYRSIIKLSSFFI
jgi:hypothetical protein